jgi:hypothetical protein
MTILFASEETEMIGLCTPAGMEEFFRAAGWDLSEPKPEWWAITPESMVAAAAATGQKILGPPLSASDASIPAMLGDR